MKRVIVILIVSFLPLKLIGQTINDSILTSFYNKLLFEYFSDSTNINSNRKFKYALILTDFDKAKLTSSISSIKIKYLNRDANLEKELDKPFKNNNLRNLYSIEHKVIAIDTIDIILSSALIEISKKKILLSMWCGGTMGYIPEGRFVFSHSKNSWLYINKKTLIDEQLSRETKMLRKQ